jgi:hypothetical protein
MSLWSNDNGSRNDMRTAEGGNLTFNYVSLFTD